MKNLFFVFGFFYIASLIFAIYGLFVSELSLKIGTNEFFHVTLTGWIKNIICLILIFWPGIVGWFYLCQALYRAVADAPTNH